MSKQKKKPEVKPEWLELTFECEEAGAVITIRQWFGMLLSALWQNGEGFSGKRPLGNSGWDGDLKEPLVKAGAIQGKFCGDEEDSWVEGVDRVEYENVVAGLIDLMTGW